MTPEELHQRLLDPHVYPFPPGHIELHETHASCVYLTDNKVFKVKKPVNLGFLDFSTLERRQHFCAQEVLLNRRFAPDTYLGVVPITIWGQFPDDWPILGTADRATVAARLLTVVYFLYFLLMPWYTAIDKTKPVPERVTG